MKKILTQWLLFKSYERKALVTLIILILLSFTIPEIYYSLSKPPLLSPIPDSAWISLQVSNSYTSDSSKTSFNKNNTHAPLKYFYFNPNILSVDSFQLLGLSEKQAKLIIEIRSKGFSFKNDEDWLNYRYLSEDKKNELLDWLQLPKNISTSKSENSYSSFAKLPRKTVNINTADSIELEQLPGIGVTLSKRIIKYRNKLGGFHSLHQLSEIWGLQDSVFQKIKPLIVVDPSKIKKVAINLCSPDELQQHPYAGKRYGTILLRYKSEHGNFRGPEDLKSIRAIPDSVTAKLVPYLDFRDE